MTLSMQQIEEAEAAVRNVNAQLSLIGRELYRIRNGESLSSNYVFDSYSKQSYEGDHCSGQQGPDWGVGTEILSLCFADGGYHEEVVTLPQGWLEQDWRELECDRLLVERQEAAALKASEDILAEERKCAYERQEYERLKAKFSPEKIHEGTSPCPCR